MPRTEANPFEIPSKPDELIGWLDERREKARRRMPELQWKLNLSFVLGHQYVYPDPKTRMLNRVVINPRDPNAPTRLTINKMGSIVERTVSKLTKENPIPECRPASDDDNDVSAAKVGTRILTHEMDRLKWSHFLVQYYFWPVTLGTSYVYVGWDKEAGPLFDLASAADAGIEIEGDVHEGDIVIEKVPAFELAVDPNATSMRDARWCIWTKTMSREAVWEKYGKVVQGAKPTGNLADEVLAQVKSEQKNSKGAEADTVAVHQFWLVPGSRAAKKGLVVTWCGATVLEEPMDFPHDNARLPFVQTDLLPGMGPREGRTWVNDLIPMQIDYNDARSRESTIRKMLNPKILSPTGAIDTQRLSTKVDVIQYRAVAGKPDWMMPPNSWMQQHEQTMGRSDSEMGERSGQSDATQGQAAASMPAAAIIALQEADDTKLAISAKMLSHTVAEVGWHILTLVQQYWLEDRMVRTWSEEGDLEAHRFSGADVQNVLDVHVAAESSLPRSKAARTSIMVELQSAGLFPDPRLFLRALDMPGMEFLIEHLNVDAKQAQRENTRLREGINCKVNHFDSHVVHLTEHNNFRKTQEYEMLGLLEKAVFDAHCALHESLVGPQGGIPGEPGPQVDPNVQPPYAGTPAAMAEAQGPQGSSPAGGQPMYTNAYGGVNDPLAVASGQAPSALEGTDVRRRAGVGGPGQPGATANSPDSQAASMGR